MHTISSSTWPHSLYGTSDDVSHIGLLSDGGFSYAVSCGVFQFLLGALRLGIVVNLLAHPVIIGFTNAAAIIIATSQLSKIFGVLLSLIFASGLSFAGGVKEALDDAKNRAIQTGC